MISPKNLTQTVAALFAGLMLHNAAMAGESDKKPTQTEKAEQAPEAQKPDPSWIPQNGLNDASRTAVWPSVQRITVIPSGAAVNCVTEPNKPEACVAFGFTKPTGTSTNDNASPTDSTNIATWLFTESQVKTPLILFAIPHTSAKKKAYAGSGNSVMEAVSEAAKKNNALINIGCTTSCVYVVPEKSPIMKAIQDKKTVAITTTSDKDNTSEMLYIPDTNTINTAISAWQSIKNQSQGR